MDTTDTDRSASLLDLHLEIYSEGWLRTKLYDKKDDFNFPIMCFPFIYVHVATFQQHLHIWSRYISQLSYDIPDVVVPIRISLI